MGGPLGGPQNLAEAGNLSEFRTTNKSYAEAKGQNFSLRCIGCHGLPLKSSTVGLRPFYPS